MNSQKPCIKTSTSCSHLSSPQDLQAPFPQLLGTLPSSMHLALTQSYILYILPLLPDLKSLLCVYFKKYFVFFNNTPTTFQKSISHKVGTFSLCKYLEIDGIQCWEQKILGVGAFSGCGWMEGIEDSLSPPPNLVFLCQL